MLCLRFWPPMAAVCLGLSLFCAPHSVQAAAQADFAYVKDGEVWLENAVYHFSGANTYQMLDSADAAEQQFKSMQALGLNAFRMWGFAFGEGKDDQTKLLVYNSTPGYAPPKLELPEAAWQQFDYVLKRAADLHLHVIIPLVNYWDPVGSIATLLRWAEPQHQQAALEDREDFYASKASLDLYRWYVGKVLDRVNHLTGVAYKDDPTILMWEPINEPRGRKSPDGRVVPQWINWAAGVIKEKDKHHLVGTGTEGFFAHYKPLSGLPWQVNFNQYAFQAGSVNHVHTVDPDTKQTKDFTVQPEGIYFPDDCVEPNIDVCSVHGWPMNWFVEQRELDGDFMLAWVKTHADAMATQKIKKPLYLGEFGLQTARSGGFGSRDHIFSDAYQAVVSGDYAGAAYWSMSLADPGTVKNGLTFDVLCGPHQQWDSTCEVIKKFSQEGR